MLRARLVIPGALSAILRVCDFLRSKAGRRARPTKTSFLANRSA